MKFVKKTEINKETNLASIFAKGNMVSKLSFFVWGIANIANGQIVKGIMFLLLEIGYIFYISNFALK